MTSITKPLLLSGTPIRLCLCKVMERYIGFSPVFNNESKVLILGSFPSVKSRQVEFYYGNKQNRFWRTICGFFGEEIPDSIEGKIEFLFRRKIALWDMAMACDIQGSADSSVKNVEVVNLDEVLSNAPIKKILLNGTLACQLFIANYPLLGIPHVKMPSTSPANPRFSKEAWEKELYDVFRISP